MAGRWSSAGVAIALLAAVSRAGAGQPALFSSTSELVVLSVTVKDGNGAYVGGLPADSFRVLEDGRPQPVRFFVSEDVPVTVGLVIDASGSMRGNRDLILAAASTFASAGHPNDELFALTFNDRVQRALPAERPFTSDPRVFHHALADRIAARGRTALYDAISDGLDYVARGARDRKVLIVVSDGGDNASTTTLKDVVEKAQASAAVIYAVALVDGIGGRDSNPKRLRQLAQSSGGEAFLPDAPREVEDVLRRIARDIRNTYTVGYVPANAARDGTFRKISVSVKAPDRKRLVVRARSGYLAASSTH